METLNVKLQEEITNNYSISFGNDGGRRKIIATNVNDFICTNTVEWITFSHSGKEMEIIALPNTSGTERTTELYLKSKFYYNSYAVIEIVQSKTVYSVKTANIIEGLKVYNENKIETKEEIVNVSGATKRCIVKGIKQYLEEENYDGTKSYYQIDFDNAIKASLKQTKVEGVYTLQIYNYGKVTKGNTYYTLVLCHQDDIDTECEITIKYEEESSITTLLDNNGNKINTASLRFDNNGYCSDSIIKLFTTEETVNYTTENSWLYCKLGYDCIKIFADYNDSNSDRKGSINIGDSTISVTQSGKINTNLLSMENGIAMASLMDEEIVEDTTPAIELVGINGNIVECKTYIYNSKTNKYDNDSQIAVFVCCKWLSYEASYNIDTKTHLITFIPQENQWELDRCGIVKIANAEDNYKPLKLEVTQSYQKETVKIEQLSID